MGDQNPTAGDVIRRLGRFYQGEDTTLDLDVENYPRLPISFTILHLTVGLVAAVLSWVAYLLLSAANWMMVTVCWLYSDQP